MTDWYHGLTTAAWSDRAQATFQCAETSARGDADTAAFRPPRRSDAPPEGNVNTLANGERLDTPQRFFDFLECFSAITIPIVQISQTGSQPAAIAPSNAAAARTTDAPHSRYRFSVQHLLESLPLATWPSTSSDRKVQSASSCAIPID